MRRLGACLVTACGLALIGCSGGGPPTSVTTTTRSAPHTFASSPAPTTPSASAPAVAQTYTSVIELRDAAVAAGLPCPHWQQSDVILDASESGDCSGNAVISTYATAARLDRAVERVTSFPGGVVLVGPNWIINAPQAPKLAKVLGGTVTRS
jgi:hypothetical protein